jgi:hypothetical protein|tara:strand:+ start:395 stop:742 length:348 start_codon:yes stop_codon:yes gene_type:complete
MRQVAAIETQLNDFLLRDVVFLLSNGKTLKKGKLILFKFKEFHFVFTLRNHKDETRVYEIPYPYSWERHDAGNLKFSYELEDLAGTSKTLLYRVKLLDKSNCNKFYDSSLVLSVV